MFIGKRIGWKLVRFAMRMEAWKCGSAKNGGLNMSLIKWLYRVEVNTKKEAEKVVEVAKEYGAMWKRGKPHGKPGAIKCCVYVEADAFGTNWCNGRDMLRDIMPRRVPGAEVKGGEMLEVVSM